MAQQQFYEWDEVTESGEKIVRGGVKACNRDGDHIRSERSGCGHPACVSHLEWFYLMQDRLDPFKLTWVVESQLRPYGPPAGPKMPEPTK